MKKIITLIVLFVTILSFGQKKEYKYAKTLYKAKLYAEANTIIDKILNNEYGNLNIDDSRENVSLQGLFEMDCWDLKKECLLKIKDYKAAYNSAEKYNTLFRQFVGSTEGFNEFANTELKTIKSLIENSENQVSASIEVVKSDNAKSNIKDNTETKAAETTLPISNNKTESERTTDTSETKAVETTKPISDDKTVTLTVSATGKTLEEAKLNALRSAIEQAFGAFISSKTEILNDKLVKDEIVSVANGNVEKYDIISQVEVPLVGFATTLNATVSIAKLTSFAESKGVVVEFKGGVFGLNMKLQKLNEKNELQSAIEILGIVHESLQNSFDYKIDIGNSPQFVNENLYKLPISVSVYSNDNYDKIIGYLTKSLKGLSMDNNEIENYKKINKKIYEIIIYLDDKKGYKFYLRNEYSFQTISNIFKSWEFYLGNYRVSNNVNIIDGPDQNTELSWRMSNRYDDPSRFQIPFAKKTNKSYNNELIYENGKKLFSNIEYMGNYYNKKSNSDSGDAYNNDTQVFFTFPWTKEKIVIFSWGQPYKLNEIEKLTNFEVKSKGIISQFSNGGYLLHEMNGGKIIAAPYEINTIDGERIVSNIGNLLWASTNPTNDSFGTSIENTAIFAQAGEKTIGVMMNKFNKSQSTNWSIPSAKESLLMYIKLKKTGVLSFYEYKYYLSSTLPKEDKSNGYTYVISEDLGSTDELYSDFINNLKIPIYDFINENYKNHLIKCRDGQKVIIKPIKYIIN